jgi:hypothetical protein
VRTCGYVCLKRAGRLHSSLDIVVRGSIEGDESFSLVSQRETPPLEISFRLGANWLWLRPTPGKISRGYKY